MGLVGCGGGGAEAPAPAPPPAATYDIVFDHELPDGSRALRRVAADGGAVQAVPGAINAVRPHARADGLALVFTTHSIDPNAVPTIMLQPAPAVTPVALSTSPGVYEREVVFSPDGRQVAFVSQRDEPQGADIFVATLNGTRLENVRNLTPRVPGAPAGLDVTPAWSPDGTQIAFASNRAGTDFTLWVMNADGSNVRALTSATSTFTADVFPSWSPDGRTLAFQRRSGDVYRVGLVQATGGVAAFFEFGGNAYAPAWSPDGQRIAFVGQLAGEVDIHVRAADGSGAVTRIPHAGADRNPAWIRRAAS